MFKANYICIIIYRYKGKRKPNVILAEMLWWSKTILEKEEDEEDAEGYGDYNHVQEQALMEYEELDHSDEEVVDNEDEDDPMDD